MNNRNFPSWSFPFHNMFPRIGSTMKTPQLTILWWLMPRTMLAPPAMSPIFQGGVSLEKRTSVENQTKGSFVFFRGDIIKYMYMLDMFSQIPANCCDVFCRSKQLAKKNLVGGFNLIEKKVHPQWSIISPIVGKNKMFESLKPPQKIKHT